MLHFAGHPVECSENENDQARPIPVSPRSVHRQLPATVPSVNHEHEQISEAVEESEQDNRLQQNTDGCKQNRHLDESHARQSLPSLSSDQDASEAERHQEIHPSCAPQHHSAVTARQDLDQQTEQKKPILHLWNFRAYTWVRKFSYYTTLVVVALTTLMCAQMFLVSVDCYESYNIRSEHSQCSCSFPYPWLVTAALRITSRFAFPLLLSIVFWYQVVYRNETAGKDQPRTKRTFATEIQKEHNHKIVRDIIQKFWDLSVKPSDNWLELLRRIRDKMDADLTWMCSTSLVQSFILVISLFAFHLVEANGTNRSGSSFWLGVADILSFGIVTAVSGVMLSFYFLESKIKHYIRAVHTLSSTSRTLRDKAKEAEHCITNRWYPLEIGMRFASVIIPAILLMNWASDIPLSCGFSVSIEAIEERSAAACWMGFIVVVIVGQVMVTSPFNPIYIHCTGLGMEIVFLFIFYLTFPTKEWMQLTHVLYAIVPLSYLIWYHVASICRQWPAINRTKEGNPTYVSRLASRTGLLILILATLFASLNVEYGHLHPSAIDKYKYMYNADIMAQPAAFSQALASASISSMKHERALLKQLAEKYDAMVYFVEEKLKNELDGEVSSLKRKHVNT